MEYITFIHRNTETTPTTDDWEQFLELADRSGLFRGGSAIGHRSTLGAKPVSDVTDDIAGYMRFDAEHLEDLTILLQNHPTVVHGGTVEICELPQT